MIALKMTPYSTQMTLAYTAGIAARTIHNGFAKSRSSQESMSMNVAHTTPPVSPPRRIKWKSEVCELSPRWINFRVMAKAMPMAALESEYIRSSSIFFRRYFDISILS